MLLLTTVDYMCYLQRKCQHYVVTKCHCVDGYFIEILINQTDAYLGHVIYSTKDTTYSLMCASTVKYDGLVSE